jgi:hypothetical protein
LIPGAIFSKFRNVSVPDLEHMYRCFRSKSDLVDE